MGEQTNIDPENIASASEQNKEQNKTRHPRTRSVGQDRAVANRELQGSIERRSPSRWREREIAR